MTIDRGDFTAFFAAVNGCSPFQWQERLLDHVLDHGRWPENIGAPTGSGKSNVVDVHAFANALHAAGAGPRVPRRLSVVVNRRAIVDQHLERATQIRDVLSASGEDVVGEVADLLTASGSPAALQVVSIRGGVPTDRTWLDDPRQCAVIAATPDMWGSRILFGGYGSVRHAWPREAGFLAYDNALILDEAHLNRQLLDTARSVARMVDGHPIGDVPGLQVVATTATPGAFADRTVGVERTDLDDKRDSALTERLTSPKLVRTCFELSNGAKEDARVAAVTREALEMRDRLSAGDGATNGRHTILCVLNNVTPAAMTAKKLGDAVGPERVVVWAGPMRPMDLEDAKQKHPGLFTTEGSPDIDFLVATQTVEVGVDIDCAGLVTEIAPGSSLSQRFGRVNRLGRQDSAEVVVIGPADRPISGSTAWAPYAADELAEAHTWLTELGYLADVSPWRLVEAPAPGRQLTRQLSELTAGDVRWLANTSAEDFWPTELNFFLRDDLDAERATVQVVVRRGLPDDIAAAKALLEVTKVVAEETFSVPIGVGHKLLQRVLRSDHHRRGFVWRDDSLLVLEASDDDGTTTHAAIRPGDTIIVDAEHSLTTAGVITPDPLDKPDSVSALWDPSSAGLGSVGQVEVTGAMDEESGRRPQSAVLALADEILADDPDIAVDELAEKLELTSAEQLVVPPAHLRVDDYLPWLVIMPTTIPANDPETRQVWSPGSGPVTLDQHQTAVAARARLMAVSIGLGDLADEFDVAGAHHDDGKADARFQVGTLGAYGAPLMAKSRGRSYQQVRRDKERGGLPSGWRHEQLSAAYVVSRLAPGPSRDLICRLVGTSHGRGRPFFPHGASTLRSADDKDVSLTSAIDELFATGAGWDDVVATTNRRFGVWGCAFLEAVFRAADCQVSREGS